ncbi:efflux RND transporter permease subunit [Treponema pectinovorum]|uniref:efflux RND transporter permease subunit n=1 Tax=Treponema pectinovorum TaxID=164 RepID=UPI0011CC5609|nr:MMPL family transporter [Treponema pectinovorum]
MSIKKINDWFEKAGAFMVCHRWNFIIGLFILTLFCCAGLSRLKLSTNEAEWFDNWDTVKMNQDHFEEIFGSTDSVMAHIKAKDVFAPEVLEMIKNLGDRLLNEVPYADSVTSLMSLSIPIGTEDGFEVASPFEDGVPDDPKILAEKKAFILSRESLKNILVSEDSTETWLILNLEHYTEDMETAERKIAPPAMNVFNSPEFKSDKWEIRPAGLSYTEYEEGVVITEQLISKIAIGFLVMIFFLIVFIRSMRGVIVPAVATFCSLGTTLGASAWLGITGDKTMVMVAIMLTMALAVGYSVHYINAFKLHFRQTGKRKDSVIKGLRDSGWPLFFTVVTTMGGMLSFLAGGIKPMRWVGGITAAAVFMVFLYIIILLPCLYSFGKDKLEDKKYIERKGSTTFDLGVERMGKAILNKKWITVALSAIVVAVSIPGIFKIKVNLDYSSMMGEKIPYIKRMLEIARSQIGSQYSYDVLIEYADEDAIKNPQVLKNMDELTDRIATLSMTKISGGKPRVSSVTKIIKEMNRTLNNDDEKFYSIPDDYDLVSQIMFLYEISGGTDLNEYVSQDFRAAYLHVDMKGYDAKECNQNVQTVEKWIKELFPDTKTSGVVGVVMNYAVMNEKIVSGSIKSIGTSLVIILILLIIAFASVKTGLIAMIPNIVPVLLCGSVMGYAGYNLDMITAMIVPMILGIAVDDTIHFTNHIKYHFELCGNYRLAIEKSFREIGKSMIMSTVILCAMFFIFTTSPMATLARIGILSLVGLGSALIADYTLTPVLMYICKPFGKEKNIE